MIKPTYENLEADFFRMAEESGLPEKDKKPAKTMSRQSSRLSAKRAAKLNEKNESKVEKAIPPPPMRRSISKASSMRSRKSTRSKASSRKGRAKGSKPVKRVSTNTVSSKTRYRKKP